MREREKEERERELERGPFRERERERWEEETWKHTSSSYPFFMIEAASVCLSDSDSHFSYICSTGKSSRSLPNVSSHILNWSWGDKTKDGKNYVMESEREMSERKERRNEWEKSDEDMNTSHCMMKGNDLLTTFVWRWCDDHDFFLSQPKIEPFPLIFPVRWLTYKS